MSLAELPSLTALQRR